MTPGALLPEGFVRLESTIALWLYQAWQLLPIPAVEGPAAVRIAQQLQLVVQEQ
jgi:hypothetical protein